MRRLLALMDRVAGSRASRWRATLRATLAGAVLQASAFLLLFPLIAAIVDGDVSRSRWVLAILAAVLLVESFVRLRELDFNYSNLPEVLEELRLRLGAHLRRMPAEVLARRQAGDLSTVLGDGVATATMAVSEVATLYIRLVVIPAALLVGLAVVDWRLPVAALVAGVVAAPGFALVRQRVAASASEMAAADAAAASRVVEYVQGLPVLKATGQSGAKSDRLVAALQQQGAVLNRTQRSLTGPLLWGSTGAQMAVVAVVAVAVALALDAQLDVAAFAAVVVVAVRFSEPVAAALAMASVFELAQDGMGRVEEVLAVEVLPEPDDPTPITGHTITFDAVTFAYEGHDTPALEGVTFTAAERSLTALVGPSGSGKTTIARLITRWADPQAGSVRMGGTDLRDAAASELMRHIAVVFQDVYLFDTSIGDNVRMARPDASDAEVLAALDAANCGPLLARLPQGITTRVGEIGGQLSGGERQRVAIARALLKDAPIVLLDEPTSALDADSEVYVQEAIDRLVAERTVLVIAHRLSTVVAADRIVVLDDGGVTEQGDHRSLLDRNGRYASMWRAQTLARHWTVPSAEVGAPGTVTA